MVQRKARETHTLRALARDARMNMRELAQEARIGESTLHTWAKQGFIPKREAILSLAHVLGCEPDDLIHLVPDGNTQEDKSKNLGRGYTIALDTHFAFGKLKTTTMVLDGNGEEAYDPVNIHTHYDPQPATFFEEVRQAKEQIEREQAQKRMNGEPYQWNGEKYHLSKIVVSREPVREHMTLGLWFKPRDHFTGLATRRCLADPAFREKYLTDDHDWYTPIAGMSMSMGIDITVISADGYAILTQRGAHLSVHQNAFHSSVSEAVSPAFDQNTTSQAPDLYRSACRGLAEELGLREHADFSVSDIQILSFTVDTHYALYGLRGMVKVDKNADDIVRSWNAHAKDKMESKQVFAVPFAPEEICAFVLSHNPWAGGLICLYHSLVHEFGREEVESALSIIQEDA
jgi:DNA-binding Xre family transcriptional regulator